MRIKNTYKLLFFGIIIIWLLPCIQQITQVVNVAGLKGYIHKNVDPEFERDAWFSGDYQNKKEKYLNQNFGFRPSFVRLNNQIAYSLFDEARANSIIIGKENYLYELNYIKAYYGTDFIGKEIIDDKIEKIKFIQDTLSKKGIDLIIVIAAGKGSFYPQYFPDSYKTDKGLRNYDYYVSRMKDESIRYIDFNKYFLEIKDTSKYLLYPRTGIHWSFYGTILAADSILNYIEQSKNIDLPSLYWDDIELSSSAKKTDDDIEKGMNLLFSVSDDVLAYPVIKYEGEEGKQKPSVLVVADSYYWAMFNAGVSTKCFKDGAFWFYNKGVYPHSYKKETRAEHLHLQEEIEKRDVIILMATEATLPKFSWGFIDNAYDLYKNSTYYGPSEELLVTYFEEKIRKSPDWLKVVKKKAEKKMIPLDSMIFLDAKYMAGIEINK